MQYDVTLVLYRELLMKFRDVGDLSFVDPGLNNVFRRRLLYVELGWISWHMMMGMIRGQKERVASVWTNRD